MVKLKRKRKKRRKKRRKMKSQECGKRTSRVSMILSLMVGKSFSEMLHRNETRI